MGVFHFLKIVQMAPNRAKRLIFHKQPPPTTEYYDEQTINSILRVPCYYKFR